MFTNHATTGRNLEAACRGWKRAEDERARNFCRTCGGRTGGIGPYCCAGCQDAARQEREYHATADQND